MWVKKVIQVLNRPVAGKKARFKTRLAPAGWGFIGLIMCGFLMSVNFSNNLIFAMTFLLSGIAVVGWWQTRANLRGLELGDWRVKPIFAGQSAVYTLSVTNPSRVERFGLRTQIPEIKGETFYSIETQGATDMTVNRPAPKRGFLAPVAVSLTSRFPLGLFEARLDTGMLPECLVYPAPKGTEQLPDHAVGREGHQRKESGTLTDIRRYMPGDPASRIAWQALARTDEIYTKEFDGAEGEPALWLRWDDVRMNGVEEKLSQLCHWLSDVHRQGKEYGLDIPGNKTGQGADEVHRQHCLRTLALHDIRENTQ